MNIKTYARIEYIIYSSIMLSSLPYIRSIENTFTYKSAARTVEYWYSFNSPFNYYIWGNYNEEIIVYYNTDIVIPSNKELKVMLI